MSPDDREELLRCRTRLHRAEGTLNGVVWRLKAVERVQREADEERQEAMRFRLSFIQVTFAGLMMLSSLGSLALAVVIASR